VRVFHRSYLSIEQQGLGRIDFGLCQREQMFGPGPNREYRGNDKLKWAPIGDQFEYFPSATK